MNEVPAVRRWFAALRVITGSIFVYIGMTHVLGGWATAEGFQQAIGRFGSTSPLQWYTGIMVPLVLSAPGFFGPLFAYGMVATGLGLMFGLLTRAAIVAGLWLNLNNFLMGFAGGGGPSRHQRPDGSRVARGLADRALARILAGRPHLPRSTNLARLC